MLCPCGDAAFEQPSLLPVSRHRVLMGFNEDTDTPVRSSVIPSSRSDSCGDGGAAHKQHRCLKPSAKENFDLLFAPRVAPVRSAAWNLTVLSGSNIRMLSNREYPWCLLERAGAYLLLQTRLSLGYCMQYIAYRDAQWQDVQPC
ncbi:hypothetical protein B5807_07262 [Epicoccum nigrum]|jgi:hypothetical protein|uniref:Uncharacterized protein n=1 Tax=Epicoccum nigrum TaxID=105696 RepID=A0A1Y2LXD2_EPING|nr:hypothetical protein B5807_07262 [Epicoccum nigrum]